MTPETAFLAGLAVMFMFASVAAGRLRRTHRQEIAELQATVQFLEKSWKYSLTVNDGLVDHVLALMIEEESRSRRVVRMFDYGHDITNSSGGSKEEQS